MTGAHLSEADLVGVDFHFAGPVAEVRGGEILVSDFESKLYGCKGIESSAFEDSTLNVSDNYEELCSRVVTHRLKQHETQVFIASPSGYWCN